MSTSPIGRTGSRRSRRSARCRCCGYATPSCSNLAVILEYLEETQPHPLHPGTPLERAEHRSWIEFGSAVLNDIGGFYNAADATALDGKAQALAAKLARVEARLGHGPWFAGDRFTLVDAVFGPVLRYFDTFDRIADFGILAGLPRVAAWRVALASRPSIRSAVAASYPDRLQTFLRQRDSELSRLMGRPRRRGMRSRAESCMASTMGTCSMPSSVKLWPSTRKPRRS